MTWQLNSRQLSVEFPSICLQDTDTEVRVASDAAFHHLRKFQPTTHKYMVLHLASVLEVTCFLFSTAYQLSDSTFLTRTVENSCRRQLLILVVASLPRAVISLASYLYWTRISWHWLFSSLCHPILATGLTGFIKEKIRGSECRECYMIETDREADESGSKGDLVSAFGVSMEVHWTSLWVKQQDFPEEVLDKRLKGKRVKFSTRSVSWLKVLVLLLPCQSQGNSLGADETGYSRFWIKTFPLCPWQPQPLMQVLLCNPSAFLVCVKSDVLKIIQVKSLRRSIRFISKVIYLDPFLMFLWAFSPSRQVLNFS